MLKFTFLWLLARTILKLVCRQGSIIVSLLLLMKTAFFCFNQCALIRQGMLYNLSDPCRVIILITVLQTGTKHSQYIQILFSLCAATGRHFPNVVWQLFLSYACPNNNWNLFPLTLSKQVANSFHWFYALLFSVHDRFCMLEVLFCFVFLDCSSP